MQARHVIRLALSLLFAALAATAQDGRQAPLPFNTLTVEVSQWGVYPKIPGIIDLTLP